MSIEFHVLGAAGRDNALQVYIHSGHGNDRLLFDCGEGVLAGLPFAEIQRVDALFFSHLHMDHIGGFDSFFRCTYNRTLKPNRIWGPPESARILQHRFEGFMWNLHGGKEATWWVADVSPKQAAWTRFQLSEAFRHAYPGDILPYERTLLETEAFTVEAITLAHGVPTLGYLVREKPRLNVDIPRLEALGLPPGPWLKAVKSEQPDETSVAVDGAAFTLGELRAALLTEQPGDSVAYLTDFLLDDAACDQLVPFLAGCRTLVCESAYLREDLELAQRNAHLTAPQAAALAARAGVEKLVLIHLSDRYPPARWPEYLAEARAVFPNTHFPAGWGVE
ncbi:MAG: MBL fold metallo-hydrolase [Armatimonadota bacterium]